ncbi:MAG: hypothetical protein R3E32_09205 [Chitinophagales bacterium]
MKTLVKCSFSLVICFLLCNATVSAQTPSCSSSAGVVSKMWKAWKDLGVGDASGLNTVTYLNQADRAISSWNGLVGNSWATIGPRDLKINNRSENGTIMGQTNRTFITPPARNNTVTITLRKTDGKAKTGVTICTTDKNNNTRTIHSYTFNNGNYTKTKAFTISNARDKVISINMRNYSVGNKFEYTISAN